MSHFDFLEQEAPVQAPATPSITPTIRPAKTPEEVAKARQKIQDLLDEASDFDSISGGYPEPKYPKIQQKATTQQLRQQAGGANPGPLDELSQAIRPTGSTVEQRDVQPIEDPRRAEYAQLASNRRVKAAKIAGDFGIDLKEFEPAAPKPEIKEVSGTITPVEAPKPLGEPISPGDTIESLMKANGVPENDFWQGHIDLANEMGVSLNQPVNFGVGLKAVLNQPSMADERALFEEWAKTLGAGQEKDGEKEPTDRELENRADRQQLKNDLKELAQERPLQNFGSIITFVLLSMVIGPGLARLFFQKSARAGELERDIADREANIADYKRRKELDERQKIENEQFIKRLAVQAALRKTERAEDREGDLRQQLFLKGVESLHQMKQRAFEEKKMMSKEAAAAAEKREKDLEAAFNRNRAANERLESVIKAPMEFSQEEIIKAKKQKELLDEEFWTLKEYMDSLYGGSEAGRNTETEAASK